VILLLSVGMAFAISMNEVVVPNLLSEPGGFRLVAYFCSLDSRASTSIRGESNLSIKVSDQKRT
jgi:hypothetical protein